jgi:long-chain-fatty-acid---luciferin-component ligase
VRAALGAKKPFVVIGPPFRIADLCQELGRRGLPAFVEHSFVVSAGGWKGRAAETIDAATFRRQVAETLGAADETVVRDSFNMVELNTVIHECPHHRKHVPPWLLVQARDPRTNEVLPAGQTGVLAFLDATADSYPGFVLSEDFGRVLDEACPCGRVGPQVEIVRRINRIEARGCALKMASGSTHTELEGHQRFYASVHRNPDLYR